MKWYRHILLYVSWFIYCNIMRCVMIVLYGVMYSVVYIVQCGVWRLVITPRNLVTCNVVTSQ